MGHPADINPLARADRLLLNNLIKDVLGQPWLSALLLLDTPPLILFDEPFNGLDPVSALALKQLLTELTEKENCCVIMAIHDLSIIEQLHQHILVLLDGKLCWIGITRACSKSPAAAKDRLRR